MIVSLKGIHKSFGALKVLNGIDLEIEEGGNLAIVGESGCGKTTLVKIMMGLVMQDQGQVQVPKGRIHIVFQDPFASLDPLYSVRAILNESFWHQPAVAKQQRHERMVEMLKEVGLPADALNRFPHQFSGGERQRICIARALLAQGKVIILDEAVSALDVLVQRQILELLKRLKKEFNLTYIFISHNLRVVKNFSDKIAIMHKGHVVEFSSTAQFFKNPSHPYAHELLKAAFLT